MYLSVYDNSDRVSKVLTLPVPPFLDHVCTQDHPRLINEKFVSVMDECVFVKLQVHRLHLELWVSVGVKKD
jgi:hypothetical protein